MHDDNGTGGNVHPAFRKGLILAIGTLVWFYAGTMYFDVQTPYTEWFNQQDPGDKVKICIWIFIAFMMAVDAVWLTSFGLRQGRIR